MNFKLLNGSKEQREDTFGKLLHTFNYIGTLLENVLLYTLF
jgi:hypothetical protein